MTNKDFELIAKIILNFDDLVRQEIAEIFASDLKANFPKFDRFKFMRACRADPLKLTKHPSD